MSKNHDFFWFCTCFAIITIKTKRISKNRAVFTWVSKVICVYVGFTLLRLEIGLKHSRNFLNQSDVKPKSITSETKTNGDLLGQVFPRFV